MPKAPYLRFAALQRKTALLVDRGALVEALTHVEAMIQETEGLDPAANNRAKAARLALLWALGSPDLRKELEHALAETKSGLLETSAQGDLTPFSLTISAGLVAARGGYHDLALDAWTKAVKSPAWRELPVRAAHLAVLSQALARSGQAGDPAHAREASSLTSVQGSLRLLQRDWEALLGETPTAESLRQFAGQRGRALAEWNEQQIEQPMNLLLLRLAELTADRLDCEGKIQSGCEALRSIRFSPITLERMTEASPFHVSHWRASETPEAVTP